MADTLIIVDHPLVQHKLTLMRDHATPTPLFRQLLAEATLLLGYAATRSLAVTEQPVTTPLGPATGPRLAEPAPALVSILRAGNGMLGSMVDLLPTAPVGFIGLCRDPETLQPMEYYCKLPAGLADRLTILVDPMLATGNSAAAAVDRLQVEGARRISLLCLLAAPEGVARLHAAHPDVTIITGALDSHLDQRGYIVPGLGDAGDRLFGTD